MSNHDKPSTILIIDDDVAVIEQLTTYFRRFEYEPIATANPTIVDQTLAAFEVHLILLDLRMDRLNGYEVLKRLREKGSKVPVLIITSYFKDEEARLKEVGITHDEVIEKPFRDFSKIEAKIRKKLGKELPAKETNESEDEDYLNNRAKVLIVEDEEEVAEIYAEVLSERNYKVQVFTEAPRAFDYIKDHPAEKMLCVVDMLMPKLSGQDLIAQAIEINPSLKFVPISGAYAPDMKAQLKSIGFDEEQLFTKPVSISAFVLRIKSLAKEAGLLG